MSHVPVMLAQVLEMLSPRDGAHYVDGTFGGGGYTKAILEAADCRVLGIDRDPDAIARGQALVERFAGRLTLVHGAFAQMESFLGGAATQGVVLDLGVSSFQFDEPARGFSFREDGPLDMRMSRDGMSAADFVNSADEKALTRVISDLGEEHNARRIARAIVAKRPVVTTAALADIVKEAQGPAAARLAIHPATRTFQALRIHVNDELGELERGLDAATHALAPQGRLVVVSFHSLEDRIVKRFLTQRSTSAPHGSRHAPESRRAQPAAFRLITHRPLMPGAKEVEGNPLALYHVSERTRVATVELRGVDRQIAREQAAMSVLETEWAHVADPTKLEALAENRLGLSGAPAVQLSSFDSLPRRGDELPLTDSPIRQANVQSLATPQASGDGL